MLSVLSDGILLGLLLSVAAGPIFFMLIQLGIERGVAAGMTLSAGVILSDVFYVILIYFGVEWLSELPDFKWYMGLFGGLILVAFGLATMLSKYKPPEEVKITTRTYGGYFFKGIAVNVFNPFVFFLWIAVTGNMIEREMIFQERLAYFLAIIITVGLTDFIKLLLAWKIRTYMKPQHFQGLRYVAGMGLIAFGIALMYRVI